MSSRTSSSSGEGLPSPRYGERTPLKSLDNEYACLTNSTVKSRSKAQLATAPVKMKADVPFTVPETQLDSFPPTKLIQDTPPSTNMGAVQIPCELGDVTFKSFICAGGEVEISDCSDNAEESIILPEAQVASDSNTEVTVISDSMLESGCEHIEHPYHNLEMKEPYSADSSEACLSGTPTTTLASGTLKDSLAMEDFGAFQDDGTDKNVTWKSLVCDGGEVEILDATRPQDHTIPLPNMELSKLVQDNTVNSTYCSDGCAQLCGGDHAEHPYCTTDDNDAPAITTSSETRDGFKEQIAAWTDLTIESFNCYGREVEAFEGPLLAGESVPLPDSRRVTTSESCSPGLESRLSPDEGLHSSEDHFEGPYGSHLSQASPSWRNFTQDSLPCSSDAVEVEMKCQPESATSNSFITEEGGKAETIQLLKTSPLPEEQLIRHPVEADSTSVVTLADNQNTNDEEHSTFLESGEAVADTSLPANDQCSLPETSPQVNEAVKDAVEEASQSPVLPQFGEVTSVVHESNISDRHLPETPSEASKPVEMEPCEVDVSQVNSTEGGVQSPEARKSTLGSPGNEPRESDFAEKPRDVLRLLSEGAAALPLGLLSPVFRRMSLSLLRAQRDPALNQFSPEDSALECEKSLLAADDVQPAGLWAEHLESPMPRPLFNSTAVAHKPQSGPVAEPVEDLGEKLNAIPHSEVEKPVLDVPLIPDGPLQQQLRKMAEFLMLASGKMDPTVFSPPVLPSTMVTAPLPGAAPVESHSVSVGTSPVKLVDHSLNTSGLFERKREFSVVDSCTLTDPLLWNLPPGSLEGLPRDELEQRLMSSMIMVEALVQQVATARKHDCPSAGCPPSDLREKLTQTDHTELSQTTMYRDLYMEALRRIEEFEIDGSSLQNLRQHMESMRTIMTSLSGDTDAALCEMKEMGAIISDDHQSLVSHYGHIKSLFEKSKKTQMRMTQKVKEALQQRNDMRTQMEDASRAKDAAFSAMDQLRTRCAADISGLEKSLGSQQELLTALKQTYPEQVSINKAYTETLDSATHLLSQTMDEQTSLMKELLTARSLLQKAAPMLLKLNEKAATALSERDEHMCARDQAIEEREQIEEELNETSLSLQNAKEQIGDLNLQVTILASEMGVLRQKLTEKEEETGQLERKVTELSATVSSTLASYTFLEQALATENTKLQQSWQDVKQARARGDELEASLDQSERRVCELTQALAQSDEQLGQLRTLTESQDVQIQQLQDACAQLGSVREMNEFLLMENQLAREQVTESERTLSENLQGLRERNIQCEDLKGDVRQLQLENRSLKEELEMMRIRAESTQQELGEKMGQAAAEITLLLHTLQGLTNDLHATLGQQKPELQKDRECQPVNSTNPSHPPSSFVDSVMLALTADKEDDVRTETTAGSEEPEPQCDALFSETSAFTRIAVVTPQDSLDAARLEPGEEEMSRVAELLAHLGSTVTELVSTLKLVKQRKDNELKELHTSLCGLQVEQQAAIVRHEAEVSELKHQLSRQNNLVERGNKALQQKAQDDKTLMRLITEVQEAQDTLSKLKSDNNELRKDGSELRRALQQSKVESQLLREELRKAGGPAADSAQFMEEKLQLLKEVERLKASLQEVEQARAKLLERAKRHQIIHQNNQQKSENELQMLNHMINKIREMLLSLPEVVKNCEQLQQLLEYIG